MTARQMVVLASAVLAMLIGCGSLPAQAGTPGKNVPPGTMHIHGAGATFPAPLYKKWLEEYQKRRPEVMVSLRCRRQRRGRQGIYGGSG